MVEIDISDITGNPAFTSILEKGIHGGFIDESTLVHDEKQFCKRVKWIEECLRFYCTNCQMHHEVSPDEIVCPATQNELSGSPSTSDQGYRILPDVAFPDIKDYKIEVYESEKHINLRKANERTLCFIPGVEKAELYDPAGRVILLPIGKIDDVYTDQGYKRISKRVKNLVGEQIDWSVLDPDGSEFQEITYRILKEENSFHNVSPGGTGPDQGKDGFCYKEDGRRNVKIMVQVKFNNNSSGLNKRDINSMVLDAEGHDCKGLLVTTVNTTGDLETKLSQPEFMSSMYFIDVWNGVDMKEKIAKYPKLLEMYFLN